MSGNLFNGAEGYADRVVKPLVNWEEFSSNAAALQWLGQIKKGARWTPFSKSCREAAYRPKDQRFENWKLRRALALPYFLRSTTRESRVRKPPFLSTLRSSGSKLVSAFEMP